MTATLYPDSVLVACGWFRTMLGLDATRVGPVLPPPSEKVGGVITPKPWVTSGGFIQLTAITGVDSAEELEIYRDLVQVDCYAIAQNSAKPPIAVASDLAQRAHLATKRRSGCEMYPPLPPKYHTAYVRSVTTQSRPRPLREPDASGSSRFQFDVWVNWSIIGNADNPA